MQKLALFVRLVLACLCSFVASRDALAQSFVNFEAKHTTPARLSPDGSRLFVVNTPDSRLSVFDVTNPKNPILIAEIPVGLEPVSVNPLNNEEAWVVNEVSDSVSIVSVSQRTVIDTLHVKDEPGDVVFANGRAFVTSSRRNEIAVFNIATRAAVTSIAVFGEHPRSLCVNSNGTRVYAAFLLSGNRTTIIPFDQAPPQPSPSNPHLPPPPRVSLIVDAIDPAWTNRVRYTMPDNDLVEIDTASLAITRYFPRVGAVNFAVTARPGSGDLYVANTDARNTTRFEPVIRGGFVTNQVSRVNIASGAVTRFDLNPGFAYTNFPNLANQSNALAQPTAIAFNADGNSFFVTAYGSDRVALVDADSGGVLARINVNPDTPGSVANPRTKRGPRGLALNSDEALYVVNRIANTLTVIDPGALTVVREIPVGSHDPTPAVIRAGRGFLYDAKLSGGGLVSCASCHIDGDLDMLAWDLGNPEGSLETNRARVSGSQLLIPGGFQSNFVFHPMKGPMTTQTLRGLNGLDPLHWRGDRTNFLHFNGAFDGLMGGSLLSASDMQAYRAFINTIVFQPNPNQNLDRTLPATFEGGDPTAGRNAFMNTNYNAGLRCNTCHLVPTGTDRSITPAQLLQEPQDFKVPQLRNVYQKMRFTNDPGAESLLGYGLIHDGTDPSLFKFLSRSVFGTFANDPVVKRNVSAFVMCFDTGVAPAVGYARTITAASVSSAGVSNDWSLLEGQALTNNIDIVVKGTVGGAKRGYVFQRASNNYRPDRSSLPPVTRAQFVSAITNGATLTIMGVPPGSGTRLGIDRDLNGVLDGDVPAPPLRIARASQGSVVAWPTNAGGFLLEAAGSVPSMNWSPETSERAVVGSDFNVTNAPANGSRFFRLKSL